MSYSIEYVSQKPLGFEAYRYRVLKDGQLIAHYWHDHKGDEHGIDFVDGRKVDWPVGRMTDFVEGGGPTPLALTAGAVAFLREKAP